MSYPEWPKTLPLPLRDGYGIEDSTPILRTDMDDGLARQRSKSFSPPANIPVEFSFSGEEHAVFRSFLENECDGSAGWFSIRLLFPGFGLENKIARLKPGYKSKLWGLDVWIVSGTIEIKKQPVIDANLLALLSEYRYDDLLNAANIAHNYVELRYPEITIQ